MNLALIGLQGDTRQPLVEYHLEALAMNGAALPISEIYKQLCHFMKRPRHFIVRYLTPSAIGSGD
jgi:hypothetical protein